MPYYWHFVTRASNLALNSAFLEKLTFSQLSTPISLLIASLHASPFSCIYLEFPDGSKADGGLGPSLGIEVGYMF